MEEKKKLTFRDIKARAVDGARGFALFFKEFKWDKEHVSVLVKYTAFWISLIPKTPAWASDSARAVRSA